MAFVQANDIQEEKRRERARALMSSGMENIAKGYASYEKAKIDQAELADKKRKEEFDANLKLWDAWNKSPPVNVNGKRQRIPFAQFKDMARLSLSGDPAAAIEGEEAPIIATESSPANLDVNYIGSLAGREMPGQRMTYAPGATLAAQPSPPAKEKTPGGLAGLFADAETAEDLDYENKKLRNQYLKNLNDPAYQEKKRREKFEDKNKTNPFEEESSFRKEIANLPEVKDFKIIRAGFDKVSSVANKKSPTATDDMSLIFGFMKMQDPNSTVREGEYATAEQTRGLSDKLVALYNKAYNGQRLTPEQRANFINSARSIFDSSKYRADQTYRNYETIISKRGLDKSNIFLDLGGDVPNQGDPTQGQGQGVIPSAVAAPPPKSRPDFKNMSDSELKKFLGI